VRQNKMTEGNGLSLPGSIQDAEMPVVPWKRTSRRTGIYDSLKK
jgi:hypothetical protein